MTPIPDAIIDEVLKQQHEMGWPDAVPAYAVLPDALGRDVYCRHQDLTVALCEQLVEHHSRIARHILQRYRPDAGRGRTEDAARHILSARLYRCRYIQLTEEQESTEDDMPFPYHQW